MAALRADVEKSQMEKLELTQRISQLEQNSGQLDEGNFVKLFRYVNEIM